MLIRRMTIEAALRWAYREELPKAARGGGSLLALGPAGPASPGSLVDMVAETWALPDNAFGLVADTTATEDPHPDAVAIHQAVLALDAIAPVIPDDWAEAAGVALHGLEDRVMAAVLDALTAIDRDGARVMRIAPSQIVRTAAIIGLPDMTLEAPELRVEVGANGKPRWFRRVAGVDSFGHPYEVEVDGFDAKRRCPYPDAYQRHFLDPDPVSALANRARAELWRAALDVLVEDLEGVLTAVEILPSAVPLRPWESGGPAIWPDLTARRWALEPRARRPLAGPVWKGRRPEKASA